MTDTHALNLIRAVEEADSASRLAEAVRQLATARLEAAIPVLITALGYNNPGAAVAAVDGLIQLGDVAVPALLEQIDGYNYSARAWAIRALAGIAHPQGLPTLLAAVKTDFAMSVRRAAAKGLGTLRWHLLPLEDIQAAQAQALEALLHACQHDEEWIVRYAAVVGLQTLAITVAPVRPAWFAQILAQFERSAKLDDNLAVQARIWLAQRQLSGIVAPILSDHDRTNSLEANWRSTLEKLYNRKSQERQQPLAEGDPRRFRGVAASIIPPEPDH